MTAQADLDRWRAIADQIRRSGVEPVPCGTCGEPTPHTITKRCNGCWEVEHRLDDYLRRGGNNARLQIGRALVKHFPPGMLKKMDRSRKR